MSIDPTSSNSYMQPQQLPNQSREGNVTSSTANASSGAANVSGVAMAPIAATASTFSTNTSTTSTNTTGAQTRAIGEGAAVASSSSTSSISSVQLQKLQNQSRGGNASSSTANVSGVAAASTAEANAAYWSFLKTNSNTAGGHVVAFQNGKWDLDALRIMNLAVEIREATLEKQKQRKVQDAPVVASSSSSCSSSTSTNTTGAQTRAIGEGAAVASSSSSSNTTVMSQKDREEQAEHYKKSMAEADKLLDNDNFYDAVLVFSAYIEKYQPIKNKFFDEFLFSIGKVAAKLKKYIREYHLEDSNSPELQDLSSFFTRTYTGISLKKLDELYWECIVETDNLIDSGNIPEALMVFEKYLSESQQKPLNDVLRNSLITPNGTLLKEYIRMFRVQDYSDFSLRSEQNMDAAYELYAARIKHREDCIQRAEVYLKRGDLSGAVKDFSNAMKQHSEIAYKFPAEDEIHSFTQNLSEAELRDSFRDSSFWGT